MKIEVNVSDVDLMSEVDGYTHDGEGPRRLVDLVVDELVRHALAGKWNDALAQRVQAIRDDEIRAQVRPVIAEALSGPIQRTNVYGEPTGQTTTLREIIVDEARKSLSGRVGEYRVGEYGRNESLAVKIVREEVDRTLDKELRETVAEEKAKVKAAVGAKAGALIAEALTAGLGR